MSTKKFGCAFQCQDFTGFKDLWFSCYDKFKKHIDEFDETNSHFYEIISGKQGLYFDFDGLEPIDTSSFEELAKIIKNEFLNNQIKIDLYSSCGFEKFSYHVVVKGIYFEDHKECEFSAKKIVSQIKSNLKKSFDSSVYTSRRNFRLLGSRKIGSMRIKKFSGILYQDEKFVHPFINDQFRLSLITDITGADLCKPNIFSFADETVVISKPKTLYPPKKWNEKDFSEIDEFLCKYYQDVFSNNGLSNDFVLLLRKKPSNCILCNRIHDAENAYIMKTGKNLYFVCRRNNGEKFLINENWSFTVKVEEEKINTKESNDYSEKSKKEILGKIKNIYGFD